MDRAADLSFPAFYKQAINWRGGWSALPALLGTYLPHTTTRRFSKISNLTRRNVIAVNSRCCAGGLGALPGFRPNDRFVYCAQCRQAWHQIFVGAALSHTLFYAGAGRFVIVPAYQVVDYQVLFCRKFLAVFMISKSEIRNQKSEIEYSPIGIFDSGYGGLTVFKEIAQRLPQYDYIYLGDNARAPYGPRSFETVYEYTLQAVNWFFEKGCPLVILACNTASAKALRSIQQNDLPKMADPTKRILGVIRPSTEIIGEFSATKKVGVLGTTGTVNSGSYIIEIEKFWPEIKVYQQACPMWVPLVENNEHLGPGADYFIKKNLEELLAQDEGIDTLLLACTHYPLLEQKIKQYISPDVKVISQGGIVAAGLEDYLKRHPEMETRISRRGQSQFYTTDNTADFDAKASIFFGKPLQSIHAVLQ
jgi:glutamate racemase